MIRWFRTKRQLIARIAELEALAARLIVRIETKDGELREYDRALTALQESFDRTRISRELADVIREETQMKRRLDV